MLKLIASQCPEGNCQDEYEGCDALVIHGPSWTNWMPFDRHARTVVLENLRKNKWHIEVERSLGRVTAVTPWRPEYEN